MPKQPPTASTIGPCPSVIQIVGRTGSLPNTIAPPDRPHAREDLYEIWLQSARAEVV